MKISEKIKRLRAVDLHLIVNDSARDNEDKIVGLNQDQMFDRGVMNIKKPNKKERYAPSTIRQKKRKATFKKTEFITLKWFGEFYDAMKLIFFDKSFVITSDDIKWANWLEVQDRFENALGLTGRSMVTLKKILKPSIIRKLRRAI